MYKYLYVTFFCYFSISCSSTLQSFKRHVGGEPEKIKVVQNNESKDEQNDSDYVDYQEQEIKFNEDNSRRTAHNPLNNSSQQYGSLWDGSGQQSFLFARNLQKKIGDLITIKVEDETKKQLIDEYQNEYISMSTKTKKRRYLDYILGDKKEFKRNEVKRLISRSANYSEKLSKGKKAPKSTARRIINSDEVTARVVEVMSNSSYKIQGVQRLSIKKKPYKMLLSGLIKSVDIGPDDSVTSSRMIDKKVKFIKINN